MNTVCIVRRKIALVVIALAVSSAASADCPPNVGLADLLVQSGETRNEDESLKLLTCAFNQNKDNRICAAALRNRIGRRFEQHERFQEALGQYEGGLTILSQADSPVALDLQTLLEGIRGSSKSYQGRRRSGISQDLYAIDLDDAGTLAACAAQDAAPVVAYGLSLNAGNMYAHQLQYAQAERYYTQAAAAAGASGDEARQVQVASNRAWVAMADERVDDARAILDALPALRESGAGAVEVRRALLAVAVNLREQGKVADAIVRLDGLAGLYAQADDERGAGRLFAHLGTAHLMNDDADAALIAYNKALALNAALRDSEIDRHANGGLARAYQALDKLQDAQRHYVAYFDALGRRLEAWETDQGRAGILADQVALFRDFVTIATGLAVESGDFRVVRAAAEQGRSPVLTELLRRSRCATQPGVVAVGPILFGDDWYHLQNEYAGHAPMVQMAAGVPVDQRAGNASLDCLVGGNPGLAVPAAKAAAAAIPTLLEYFLTGDALVITVVHGSGKVDGAVSRVTPMELKTTLNDYLNTLGVSDARGMEIVGMLAGGALGDGDEAALARRLHAWLIEPVARWLPSAPGQTVLIVPHGDLWRLPFGALLDDDGERLVDRHALTYLSSETAWHEMVKRPRQFDHRAVKAWIAGNPAMPKDVSACGSQVSLAPLPGAQAEAEAIAAMLGADNSDAFYGSAADRLRLEAWHGAYSVLHFATHGFACAKDPLSSFIALADIDAGTLAVDTDTQQIRRTDDQRLVVNYTDPEDVMGRAGWSQFLSRPYAGVLTAGDVINRFSLNADLVTLSACQTGVGQLSGEGMIGFTRAFLAAGARSLLVSLWRVDDSATSLLMTAFYREYLVHGDKSRALQTAMNKTRAVYPQPQYWAAFSLVGLAE